MTATDAYLRELLDCLLIYIPDCDLLKETYQDWTRLPLKEKELTKLLFEKGLIKPRALGVRKPEYHFEYNRRTLILIHCFETWSELQDNYGAIGNSPDYSQTINTNYLDQEVCKFITYLISAVREAQYALRNIRQNPGRNPISVDPPMPEEKKVNPRMSRRDTVVERCSPRGMTSDTKSKVHEVDLDKTLILEEEIEEDGPSRSDSLVSSEEEVEEDDHEWRDMSQSESDQEGVSGGEPEIIGCDAYKKSRTI